MAAVNMDSFGSVFTAAVKYGPLIVAMIESIEKNKTADQAQISANNFERGFRVLTQTKDPSQLQAAVMSHCNSIDGCMLP